MLLSTTSRALPRTLRILDVEAKSSRLRPPNSRLHPTNLHLNPPTHLTTHHPLSLGTTTSPPSDSITPSTFTPNPSFLPLLSQVLSKYAHLDPQLQSQAAAFATTTSHFSLSPPSTYRASEKGKIQGLRRTPKCQSRRRRLLRP
ncbi:hypothetical protein DID88_006802 [Monilinia fructigena]|uniref:Uncharacterized protein n=1 Tax=Monilinia fructigena TaxID=38457 RepID=A0A395IIZ5_9HELO|nr:hypothetical protein DID88_006802 [Monilinia fructigena]